MKYKALYILIIGVLLWSCSMTKDIPDGDQLFTGLKAIDYQQDIRRDSTVDESVYDDNYQQTQLELEAALATAPNGAIFGSSYYHMPFSLGVSIWNHYSTKDTPFARWMTKTFGKQPVLMSWVNPKLRAQVAQNVLSNHGYFNGKVDFEEITSKNPKKAKIQYTINPGRLMLIDSISYLGFPAEADSLIRLTMDQAYIKPTSPFVVSNLEAERSRISSLLRNNGYYYYQPGYASYLADTFLVDGRAKLRFQLANDIPAAAKRKWYIGRIDVNMRKTRSEQYTDSIRRRTVMVRFSGKKPPIRLRALLSDMKLRSGQMYSYDNYLESMSKINAMGLFSSTEFQFTPRDNTDFCDTLDLTLNCTFDKPWDFYVETNFNSRTIGRMGPEIRMGVTRRNAFRGGEKIDVNVHGSYEWTSNSADKSMNNYEYGADGSVEFPRIIAPFYKNTPVRRDSTGRIIRRRYFSTPSTLAKASTDIIYRPNYYKMHIVSGEWTYRWQTSAQSRHEFSPLTVKYQFMNSHTDRFDSLVQVNPYLSVTMQDYFISEMRYTYTYSSPAGTRNPIRWETTVAESGNGIALYDVLTGKGWNERGKKMFKNTYSQFLKIETDLTKTWTFDSRSKLVGHVNAGVAYAYGNTDWLPNSEMFYVGGANSIRAFSVRGIGPGRFNGNIYGNNAISYLLQNGDIKFVCNLEYRRNLFSSLNGAIFLDAGNVWNFDENYGEYSNLSRAMENTKFQFADFFRQLGVGTGIGLRYDMDFLVLRLDWGVALHVPYDTGHGGFYNVGSFKGSHTLHFAIGYPF